ncbi:hypothetical protein [Streptomyces thermolilacinus]|uniref:hypothetical protein n=1 Tax=Streptomyces thermolilacinus TaxID=285540 RepID=UPI0003C759EC|nr:hypothetical protein [Streptomyces thermolilacinus]
MRFAGPEFAHHVHTDRLTVPQVADAVAAHAGLRPLPSTYGHLRHRPHRAAVGLRHTRLGQGPS